MADYVRTQVLLEKRQRELLNEIAEQTGISFSELLRQMIDAQLHSRTYDEMQHAAEKLCDDYRSDSSLTEMTALDGEDFLNV
jgi:hypothetical protein